MIEIGILAISDKYDPAGVLCLAAIPVLILALIPFRKGFIVGSGANCIAFFIFVLWLAGPDARIDDSIVPTGGDWGYITNESHTKWIGRHSIEILRAMGGYQEGSVLGGVGSPFDHLYVLPQAEKEEIEKTRRITIDDYYIHDEVYPTINVPVEDGGGGIPQWLYHPACLVYITGFFALPALGLGAVINRKL